MHFLQTTFSTKHELGRNISQPCLDIYLFLSVWLEIFHQLPGGRRHHQEELCLGQNEGYQTAREARQAKHTTQDLSVSVDISGILIKSLEDNILPRNLIPHLQRTCKGRRETELKNCIENVLLAFDNVVVNTSHQVDQESVLIQFGLGKISNISTGCSKKNGD